MTVLGTNTVGGSTYQSSAQSHLIPATAGASGTITQLLIYCRGNSGAATSLVMGVYADASGEPGALLGITNVLNIPTGQAAAWLTLTLQSAVAVTSGTAYWVAMSDGGGGAQFAYASALTTKGRGGYGLPNPYGSPGWTDSTDMSMYGTIGSGGSVPTITAAPAVTGTATDGATLTCSEGTWSGSPTSYAYQWTRDGVAITGATAATYVPQLADRTHAVGCQVTATNSTGSSSPAGSNTVTVAAPVAQAAGRLRYECPPQTNPITLDYTASPGNEYPTLTAGADHIIKLSVTVPRTGVLEIDGNGARSVKIIGGVWALNDGGTLNYHIHIHNLMGWAFIEGQEADMANTHADFLCVSGGSLYTPDLYFQNSRIINLAATDATNHADVCQPQGLIGNLFVDKITYSSNYQAFTLASDGTTGGRPARSVRLSRVNGWYSSANSVNPFTAHYWLNNGGEGTGSDTAPFPMAFDDVWCDVTRGAGRANYNGQISLAIFPSEFATGNGKANGGNLSTGGPSPFTAGEMIGAQDSADKSYASFTDVKMLIGGKLQSGSPPTTRADVITDQDGLGSFVPTGIGSNYATPGYEPAPHIGVPI